MATDALSSMNIRSLQTLPDYTSPPTPYSISLTPPKYQDDSVIDLGRDLAFQNKCTDDENIFACQIPFYPPEDKFEPSSIGVIYYGGALVDPRGYSPIAHQLSERYGIPVTVPIFYKDLAFGYACDVSGKIDLAMKAFPDVNKWVLAGHSFGGIAAIVDIFLTSSIEEENLSPNSSSVNNIAGLALIGSYINPAIGCGVIDFSSMDMPTISISGSLDGVINQDVFDSSQAFLPHNHTMSLTILGGNHGQFGSYDDTERRVLFGQIDGNATITESLQHDMTVSGIMNVVHRAGIELLPAERDIGIQRTKNKAKKGKKKYKKKGPKKSKMKK